MIKVLFTDTHFGVRQNSINWLNSQKDFIYNQFIPYLKTVNNSIHLIHLGDVFDSRSTISTMVATEVVNMFTEISKLSNVECITIIAGNHDFYSPNSDEINSIDLFLSSIDKIQIISKDIYIDNDFDALYIPWYKWFDQENIQQMVDADNIKYIFTHADIVTSPVHVVGPKIFSGHIHIPCIKGNIYNLGSCFPLNFADANTPRGFYVIHEDERLEFIENQKSIRFWRLFNDDIFNTSIINPIDYIEVYIDQSKLGNPDYTEQISKLNDIYKNLRIIPQLTEVGGMKFTNFEGYDIESITKEFIPDNLKYKFKQVLDINKNS